MQGDVTQATDAATTAGWSRYWAAGHEHSCPTSFTGFYGSQLQAFWRRQAEGLQRDDVVLDLGCGNGALLRFLASLFPPDQSPELHGVDAAELHPEKVSGNDARIHVHARTPFAALPLGPGSVALAASLFGLEYANDDATWSELLRVLRPRARVAFVLHKRGSHLDAVAADELVVARAAQAADGVITAARNLLPYVAQAATVEGRAQVRADADAERARSRFNAASDALVGLAGLVRHGDYAHDILRALMRALAEAQPGLAAAIGARIDGIGIGIEDHVARMAALRASALDGASLERVRARLQAAGFTVAEGATISEQGFEMGWILEGRRDHAD